MLLKLVKFTSCVLFQAMKMLALNLIEAGAPIYGIGIQSHIDYVGPSIHVMKV